MDWYAALIAPEDCTMGKRLTRELKPFNKEGPYWGNVPKSLKRSAQQQREPTTAKSGTTSSAGDPLTRPSLSVQRGNGVTRYLPPILAWKARSYKGDLSSQDSHTDGEDEGDLSSEDSPTDGEDKEGGKARTKSREI